MNGLPTLMPSMFESDSPSQWLDMHTTSLLFNIRGTSLRAPQNVTRSPTPNCSAKAFTSSMRSPSPTSHAT